MWNSLWLWCFFPFQKGLEALRWTSRCSSRCPSRCAIHCGYCARTFPYILGLSAPKSRDYPCGCGTAPRKIRAIFKAPRQGKKVHTTTAGPLFSRSVARPRGHRAKKLWCIPFPGKTREKGIHHRSGKKGIHHRASDPEKEKKGVSPRWWCRLFSSLQDSLRSQTIGKNVFELFSL